MSSSNPDAPLNIGALSAATGVPVETIRTWERRYGFPDSDRNDAGHRIYEPETIEYLRLITTILSRGYRPSQLKDRSRTELEKLLQQTLGDEEDDDAESTADADHQWLDNWLEASRQLDRDRLVGSVESELNWMNTLECLEKRLAPFVVEVGRLWADGEIDVVHEHFVSECLRDVLASRWRRLSDSATGVPVVCATLPGEEHFLGLHMAAVAVAMARRKILFLGTNTPVDDIDSAARLSNSDAIAISISEFASPASTVDLLTRLREAVDDDVDILAGGRGAPTGIEGIEVRSELRELYDFLSDRLPD